MCPIEMSAEINKGILVALLAFRVGSSTSFLVTRMCQTVMRQAISNKKSWATPDVLQYFYAISPLTFFNTIISDVSRVHLMTLNIKTKYSNSLFFLIIFYLKSPHYEAILQIANNITIGVKM